MTTLPDITGYACECCGSHRGTEHSGYFRLYLCERCYLEARDRLGLADHPTLDIAGQALQQGLAL